MTQASFNMLTKGLNPTAVKATRLANRYGEFSLETEDFLMESIAFIDKRGKIECEKKDLDFDENYVYNNIGSLVNMGKQHILRILRARKIYVKSNMRLDAQELKIQENLNEVRELIGIEKI